jgi:hypothetical protein
MIHVHCYTLVLIYHNIHTYNHNWADWNHFKDPNISAASGARSCKILVSTGNKRLSAQTLRDYGNNGGLN